MGRFRLLKNPLVYRKIFVESVQVLRVYQKRYCSVKRLTFQRKHHLEGKQEDSFIQTTRCNDKALLQSWNTVLPLQYIFATWQYQQIKSVINVSLGTSAPGVVQLQTHSFSQFLTLCSHDKPESMNPKDSINKSQNIILVLCYNLLLFDLTL